MHSRDAYCWYTYLLGHSRYIAGEERCDVIFVFPYWDLRTSARVIPKGAKDYWRSVDSRTCSHKLVCVCVCVCVCTLYPKQIQLNAHSSSVSELTFVCACGQGATKRMHRRTHMQMYSWWRKKHTRIARAPSSVQYSPRVIGGWGYFNGCHRTLLGWRRLFVCDYTCVHVCFSKYRQCVCREGNR
jgi:hypothetical protein